MRPGIEQARHDQERRADEEELPFSLGQERPLEGEAASSASTGIESAIEAERDRGLLGQPREYVRHQRQPDRAGRER